MIKTTVERLNLATLKPQEINARYMRQEQYAALVANLKRDGVLTSAPLVYRDVDGDHVLSGHHRVMAGLDAGIEEADCIVVTTPLTRQQQVALQISHNAIAGEDDAAVLKQLYEELDDVEWRDYTGLDDKTLELLEKIDMTSLSEANLDFATVQLVFLPHELDAAREALDNATKLIQADERWLASAFQYEETLNSLETAHKSHWIGNVATALGIILRVFNDHLTDLQDGYLGPNGEPSRTGVAPIDTVIGTRLIPTDAAATLTKAIDGMVDAGDVPADERWKALEQLAARHLAGN